MLGMPAAEVHVAHVDANGAAHAGSPHDQGSVSESVEPLASAGDPEAVRLQSLQRTMLGVAIPGIAPSGGRRAGALPSARSTMLGVAIPGIAPTRGPVVERRVAAAVPRRTQVEDTPPAIVPRPKPLIDEPLPDAPLLFRPSQRKSGLPAVTVVAMTAALVLVLAGMGVALALRHGGTLTAVPRLEESGAESLTLGCTTCPDGTTVTLGRSHATMTASSALLVLPAPLAIGDNELTVGIDRPSAGRDENVVVHVPVAYRVRADLSTLGAKRPTVTVRVEATPGSTATVDGDTVPLDANGRGSYAVDVSKETEGPGEASSFERKVTFSITAAGAKVETGQLTARAVLVPLALDAPGYDLITDKPTVAVAGQTRPGATVTIEGQGVAVDAQGRFGVRVELAATGEKAFSVIASSPALAPRSVKITVTRVVSLEAAAKLEEAKHPLLYDVFSIDLTSKIGQRVRVEGEVIEARAAAGHTVLLVDDRNACASGATCLVRVTHGEEDKVARGDSVRVFGRVAGSVAASGKPMADVEASIVLPVRAPAK